MSKELKALLTQRQKLPSVSIQSSIYAHRMWMWHRSRSH